MKEASNDNATTGRTLLICFGIALVFFSGGFAVRHFTKHCPGQDQTTDDRDQRLIALRIDSAQNHAKTVALQARIDTLLASIRPVQDQIDDAHTRLLALPHDSTTARLLAKPPALPTRDRD